MSINIKKIDMKQQFNITISSNFAQLKDLKINGKYINKIYWCDPQLFSQYEDNCALIYQRYNTIEYTTLSGIAYNILNNEPINDVSLVFTKTNSRNKKTYNTETFPKGKDEDADIIINGYYQLSSIIGKSTYRVTASKNNYITYNENNINVPGSSQIGTYDFYLNPTDDTTARIILNWQNNPKNLDLFVICPDGSQLSYNNKSNLYGFVNYTNSNGYGPELISLTNYSDLSTPLKVGGKFNFYVRYASNEGNAYNSRIKLYTQQLGTKFFETTPETDNINRYGYQWHASQLNVNMGLKSITLSDQDLITYTKPLQYQKYSYLGSYTSYYNRNNSTQYPSVVNTILDHNQFIVNYNTLMYMLKDYPFIYKLYNNEQLIENYNLNISDNYQAIGTSQYKVYYNITNLPSAGNYSLKLLFIDKFKIIY